MGLGLWPFGWCVVWRGCGDELWRIIQALICWEGLRMIAGLWRGFWSGLSALSRVACE